MRKKELIAQLLAIKGNPEIAVWCGFVSDYMPIDKLEPELVVKDDVKFIRKMIDIERVRDNKPPIEDEAFKQLCKNAYNGWDVAAPYYSKCEDRKRHGKLAKTIYCITTKNRGKGMHLRYGGMMKY